jgi:hypothetical protein
VADTDKDTKKAAGGKQLYVGDEFQGSVFVHETPDPGTGRSTVLSAGDPIPAYAVEGLQANPEVPVTGVKSRKARALEDDEAYQREREAERVAAFEPGTAHGPSGSAEAGYDPALHSIEEVRAFLAEHPGYASHVLALERAGLNRKGLLG